MSTTQKFVVYGTHKFVVGDRVVFTTSTDDEVYKVYRVRISTSTQGIAQVYYDVESLDGNHGYGYLDEDMLDYASGNTNNAYDRAMRGI